MPRIYQKMTPLTDEEKQFSEDNYSVIEWCFKHIYGYDMQEYYDVAMIGYLKAVKRWFSRPELHKYSFKTISLWAIKSYLWNERKKEKRRRTLSLNVPIENDSDFTLIDTITYDNYLNHYELCVGGGTEELLYMEKERPANCKGTPTRNHIVACN